nr:integrase, catalytic region, zinc finger, CCHC-type, peptidase aspartic, catalytic [Tanacetum cinerariifolium]GFA20477.1 integrase, catalytic region, zinc finger, CCHC-type, peptidase aspartic, catalytic [Tanacetum cinerariifolium]
MCGSEYGEQDRKAAILYEYETFKAIEGDQFLDTYLRYLQYGTLMRQNKNLMDINIDALYSILKQNQGDVNDALGYKKKAVVITSNPLVLVAEQTKVSKRKEKVVVSSDSERSDLDTFSSVRRPKHSSVIWKKKGSSKTSNVDLSSVSLLKLNKDVKRYSHKDLLACNNSHLGEISSVFVCSDAMNVSCNSRLCDLFDENNLFIFDDESIVQIYLWIIDSGCSKHMTGNRALLTNFVENFLGTVRFCNNDFAVIACGGDV